jgi:acyl-coenzyme A synthetase/AMP-(fatty) acid ligase
VLGSVGEPINPEAWLWYYKKIGKEKCSIVDTFWQTETGGHVITPIPGATPMKPGSAVSGKIEKNKLRKFSIIYFVLRYCITVISILWCKATPTR